MQSTRVLGVLGLALLVLGGCGGGGGGGDDAGDDVDPGPDVTPPTAQVVFPPTDVLTDQERIRIRGTASDDRGVAEVRVQGQAATLDLTGGSVQWLAEVVLPIGNVSIRVDVIDEAGNETTDNGAVTVRRTKFFPRRPRQCDYDPAANRIYAVDDELDAVIAFDGVPAGDFATAANVPDGEVTLVSGLDRGTGPAFQRPTDLIVEAGGASLLAVDRELGLLRVDVASGNRTVLSGPTVGGGPFGQPFGICPGPAAGQVFVTDPGADAVLRIQLASGFRSVHSDVDSGGDPFDYPDDIVRDPETGTLYVWDRGYGAGTGALVRVGALDGARSLVPGTEASGECALAFHGSRILRTRQGDATIVAIELGNPTPVVVSGPLVGAGPAIANPYGLCVDGDDAYVTDIDWDAMIHVDLATGDRTLRAKLTHGAGDNSHSYTATAFDWDRRVAYLASSLTGHLVEVTLEGGVRRLVAGDDVGTGPEFGYLGTVAVDPLDATVYVAGGDQLFGVDPATGARTLLSGPSRGEGPDFAPAGQLAVAPDGSRVFVLRAPGFFQPAGLFAVERATGDRVDFEGVGDPALVERGQDLLYDETLGRLLILQRNGTFLLTSVDPISGAGEGVIRFADTSFDSLSGASLAVGPPDGMRFVRTTVQRPPPDTSSDPSLLAYPPDGGEIPVAGRAPSQFVQGRGPDLPADIGVDPVTGLVYGRSFQLDALLVTDPITADSAIVAR